MKNGRILAPLISWFLIRCNFREQRNQEPLEGADIISIRHDKYVSLNIHTTECCKIIRI